MHIPDKDPLHQLGEGERRLFVSLWVLLLLAFALWHFYPKFEAREVASPITVELGEELRGRITDASVLQSSPSQHTLRLQVDARYRKHLPEDGHQVLLGYDLLNDTKVVYTGAVNFGLGRADDTTLIVLPNPQRVFTRRIRIYLPQR